VRKKDRTVRKKEREGEGEREREREKEREREREKETKSLPDKQTIFKILIGKQS